MQLLYSDTETISSDILGALYDLQNAADFASMRMLRRFVRGSSLRSRRIAVVTPFARTFAGSVPDGRLMRRVAQIGDGKIFGSVEFVRETAFALGDRFRSRSVAARAVGELGFATHGWRFAGAAENVVA